MAGKTSAARMAEIKARVKHDNDPTPANLDAWHKAQTAAAREDRA